MSEPVTVAGARAPGDPGPRRSLVLAGGGMRVAYQAGALQALLEAGLRFDHADGTSGGTINLAMLMSGLTPAQMCHRWRTLHVSDFVSLLPLKEYLRGPAVPAMGDADGIVRRVYPHLGIDVAKINAAQGIVGTFNVCNFSTKTNEVITNNRVTLPHLVAGVSLPIFMPGVRIGQDVYTDSVWIKDANVLEAVRRGAEEIWIVWCIGNTPEYRDGPFPQYVHMIEMSANGKLFAELEQVAELNERIGRGERPSGRTRPIRVHVIKPDYPLPLDPDYYLGRIDGATLIALGYEDARSYCDKLAGAPDSPGAPLTPEATRMRSGAPGISFRESLQGALEAGEAGGAAPSAPGFKLRACIFIQSLEQFLSDPQRAGQVSATLDVPGLGEDLVCLRGRFRVSTADGAQTVSYEIPFVHAGEEYWLEGRKELAGLSGKALSLAFGQLRCRLHRGGPDGPLVGKGTLSASPLDVLATIESVQAIHCHSGGQAAETVAKFGAFLFRDLFERRRARAPRWQFWRCSNNRAQGKGDERERI